MKKRFLYISILLLTIVTTAWATAWFSRTALTIPPAPTDEVYVMDISDTTEHANGTAKRVDIEVRDGLNFGVDSMANLDYTGILAFQRNCGGSYAQGDAVYLDTADNEWKLADADAASTRAQGVLMASCTDGNAGKVMLFGTYRYDAGFAFTEGSVIYLSTTGTTTNTLTHTAPSGSGDVIQVLGFALSDDEAFINMTGEYAQVQ